MTNVAHRRRTVLEDLRTERDNLHTARADIRTKMTEAENTLKKLNLQLSRLDVAIDALSELAPPALKEVLYGYYDSEEDVIVVDPDNNEYSIGYILGYQDTNESPGKFVEWTCGSVPLSESSIELHRPVYVDALPKETRS